MAKHSHFSTKRSPPGLIGYINAYWNYLMVSCYTKPQWCPNIIIYEPLLLGKNTHWNGDETTGGLFKYLISTDSSFYWVIVNLWPYHFFNSITHSLLKDMIANKLFIDKITEIYESQRIMHFWCYHKGWEQIMPNIYQNIDIICSIWYVYQFIHI